MTLPDYNLIDKDVWVNAYAISGITVGQSITIQNKTNYGLLIQYGDSQPPASSTSGYLILGGNDELFTVPSAQAGVWVKGWGNVSIQRATDSGGSLSSISSYTSRSSFGDNLAVKLTPLVQVSGVYNDTSPLGTTVVGTGSAAGVANGLFYCTSGTSSTGIGAVYAARLASYHPGQGLLCRVSAIFDTPSIGNVQFAGMSSATDGLFFGYNGTQFGISHRRSGAVEIRTLTVTTPSSGSTNATVTINGTAFTVPLTPGTAAFNARQIAESLKAQTTLYRFSQNGNTVVVRSIFASPAAGVWSFSHATAVASFVQDAAGTTVSETWTYMSDWNGVVPSGFDPTKGNVYQIQMQYLGFGNIKFFIEDQFTSELKLVHTIRFVNSSLTPNSSCPSFRVGYVASNSGVGTSKTVKGGSGAVFLEGEEVSLKSNSLANSKASVGLTDTNIITIRNRETYTTRVNLANVKPMKVYGYTDSTKGVVIQVIKNTILGGTYNYSYVSQSGSIVEYDTAGTTITGGTVVGTFLLGNGTTEVDLSEIIEVLNPSETLTFSARILSGAASEVGISVTWNEDF